MKCIALSSLAEGWNKNVLHSMIPIACISQNSADITLNYGGYNPCFLTCIWFWNYMKKETQAEFSELGLILEDV